MLSVATTSQSNGTGRRTRLPTMQPVRQRGSPPVWFTDAAIAAWKAEPRTTRAGQPRYSSPAIATALTLRSVFRLDLRQTEGLIGSIIALLGLDLAVRDHTALSRRAETLEGFIRDKRWPRAPAGGQHGAEALRRGRVVA